MEEKLENLSLREGERLELGSGEPVNQSGGGGPSQTGRNFRSSYPHDEIDTSSSAASTPVPPRHSATTAAPAAAAVVDQTPHNATLLIVDDRMQFHEHPVSHPECGARIARIKERVLEDESMAGANPLVVRSTRPATDEELRLAHSQDLIDSVKALDDPQERKERQEIMQIRSLFANEHTVQSSYVACGGVIDAAVAVMKGEVRNAFAVVRPPGHHAEPDRCMGFCFFSNIAVAAKIAQKMGAERILIVDWDIHFGNGTQVIFANDPNVVCFSVHRYHDGSYYPGGWEGSPENVGEGLGEGKSVNVGWNQKRRGDAEYLAAWHRVLLPIAYEFNPTIIFVAAGFDSARGDPLGQCGITPEGYAHLLHPLLALANGRVVLALEGGYNLTSISESAAACVTTLRGIPPPPIEGNLVADDACHNDINETLKYHQKYWKCFKYYTPPPPSTPSPLPETQQP